jgi:ABC-type multidrug transport system fused ATPase/permease subunit
MALRADRVVVLRDGGSVEEGAPRALLETPGSAFATLFDIDGAAPVREAGLNAVLG